MELDGSERAAILLMSLEESDAAAILRKMAPPAVEKIASAMARMEQVSRDNLGTVVEAFSDEVDRQARIAPSTREYITRLITQAVGESNARGLVNRVLDEGQSRGLDALRWMDTREIREMILEEHPQIMAIVLAHLDQGQATDIMAHMPTELRKEVILRIATLEEVGESVLNELETIVNARSSEQKHDLKASVAGVKVAANILNVLGTDISTEIIEYLREADDSMATEVEEQMFSFETLLRIQGRGMQTLLREITNEQLIIALKGADQEIQDLIFENMSQRAGDMLRDDLSTQGPVRLTDVEEAQKAILDVAKRLADEGQILIGSGGDDFV
ncbi:MAG: flagellar motor switch protein FliG [Pseudomonadota bacterium]